jgi:hypothetical protein
MQTKKTDYSSNNPTVSGTDASSPSPKAKAKAKPESVVDMLARKMPHGMLYESPIVSPWKDMLRRAPDRPASPVKPPSPASPQAPSRSVSRLASMIAFDGHPEMAADLGRAKTSPNKR